LGVYFFKKKKETLLSEIFRKQFLFSRDEKEKILNQVPRHEKSSLDEK